MREEESPEKLVSVGIATFTGFLSSRKTECKAPQLFVEQGRYAWTQINRVHAILEPTMSVSGRVPLSVCWTARLAVGLVVHPFATLCFRGLFFLFAIVLSLYLFFFFLGEPTL